MSKKNLIIVGSLLTVILVIFMVFLLIPKKVTITFDTNGGNIIQEVTVKKGTTIDTLEEPVKEGFTFLYWTSNGKVCNKTDKITSDMNLKAVWSEKEESNIKTYTVTFNSDGGSAIDTQKVEEGKKVTIPTIPTKEGYNFVEWTLGGKSFDFDTEITKDITLVAKWEKVEDEEETKIYTVTFNTDGGSKISSKKVTEGKTVSKPANPTKNGYTFVNWTLNGKEYNFNSKVISNITLKATWKKSEDKPVVVPIKYTVTFNTNGGSSISSQTIEENGKVTKPADPKKDGYTFKGWYIGSNQYNFDTKVTSNFTLTAKWEKVEEVKTYTISVSMVDSFSPDRYLTVYENGTAITISKLMYTDGVEIKTTINGTKISVASADIVGETKFKVQLVSGKVVSATIK